MQTYHITIPISVDLSRFFFLYSEIKQALETILKNQDPSLANFAQSFQTWFQNVESQIKGAATGLQFNLQKYKDLLRYFNLPEKEIDVTSPAQFFGTIFKFVGNCSRSLVSMRDQEQKRLTQQRKQSIKPPTINLG